MYETDGTVLIPLKKKKKKMEPHNLDRTGKNLGKTLSKRPGEYLGEKKKKVHTTPQPHHPNGPVCFWLEDRLSPHTDEY